MSGFTKVFANILDSTVWSLSKDARLLWITMLVKKDRNQNIRASVPGLAHAARLSLEETLKALDELSTPDPYSQSKEEEGRRITAIDGGWHIVNGAKYRDMLNADERREYQRQWQADYRKKQAAPPAGPVTAESIYAAYPLKVGKPDALKAITKAMGKTDPEKLLKITLEFSKRRGTDKSFVPHPSTWFNQERYNDDPSTWTREDAKPNTPDRNAGTYNAGRDITALAAKVR